MNNKGVGAVFCLIAAILMSARYIAAAITALVAGICFLGYGVFQDFGKKDK